MDLAQAFNAPETIEFGGRKINVRQLTLSEWASLMGWLKASHPSPVTQALRAIEEAKASGLTISMESREELLDHAQAAARNWPPALGSRAWLRALGQVPGGTAKFVHHVLSVEGFVLTIDEAQVLADKASQEEIGELCRVCYYGDPPYPKAETPAETPLMTSPATTGQPSSTD